MFIYSLSSTPFLFLQSCLFLHTLAQIVHSVFCFDFYSVNNCTIFLFQFNLLNSYGYLAVLLTSFSLIITCFWKVQFVLSVVYFCFNRSFLFGQWQQYYNCPRLQHELLMLERINPSFYYSLFTTV